MEWFGPLIILLVFGGSLIWLVVDDHKRAKREKALHLMREEARLQQIEHERRKLHQPVKPVKRVVVNPRQVRRDSPSVVKTTPTGAIGTAK
jgi:hypothetical protein